MKILDISLFRNHTTCLFKIYSDYDRELFRHVVSALCCDYCFSTNLPDNIIDNLPLKKRIKVTICSNPGEVIVNY